MSVATMGQASEIAEKLRKYNRDQVQKLIDGWDLVKALMEMEGPPSSIDRQAFAALLTPPLPRLFRSPEEMLTSLRARCAERSWPLEPWQLNELPFDHKPEVPTERLKALSFDIWLGSLEYTMQELVSWLQDTAPDFWQWDELLFDPKHLRLLDSDRYGNEPFVRWVEIDFGTNWNEQGGAQPDDVRDPKTSAGLQLLTAFAVHPDYGPSIDYQNVPGVWLAGLQANVSSGSEWSHVPFLNWSETHRTVNLLADREDDRGGYCSAPVFRELCY